MTLNHRWLNVYLNVIIRSSGSVAQLAECSHGKREALGSSPGRATIFTSPVTQSWEPSRLFVATLSNLMATDTDSGRGNFLPPYINWANSLGN